MRRYLATICFALFVFIVLRYALLWPERGAEYFTDRGNLITNGDFSGNPPKDAHTDTTSSGKYQLVQYDRFNAVTVFPHSYYQLNVKMPNLLKSYVFSAVVSFSSSTSSLEMTKSKSITDCITFTHASGRIVPSRIESTASGHVRFYLDNLPITAADYCDNTLAIRLAADTHPITYMALALQEYSPQLGRSMVAPNNLRTFLTDKFEDIASAKPQRWHATSNKRKVVGPVASDAFGTNVPQSFTVAFGIQIVPAATGMLGVQYHSIVNIPGNNKAAVNILMKPANAPINIILADKLYTTGAVPASATTLITLTYNAMDSSAALWLGDGTSPIETFKDVPKIYFGNSPIVINGDAIAATMTNFLLFDRDLSGDEIVQLYHYLNKRNVATATLAAPNPLGSAAGNPLGSATCNPLGSAFTIETFEGSSGKRTARKIFAKNHPGAPLPDELKSECMKDCPFVIGENNPCHVESCSEVDWKNPANVEAGCKTAVSNYCANNYELDSNGICIAWNPVHSEKESSKKIRRIFENSVDLRDECKMGDISEHPDFGNYIRKDRVPCWGCTIP